MYHILTKRSDHPKQLLPLKPKLSKHSSAASYEPDKAELECHLKETTLVVDVSLSLSSQFRYLKVGRFPLAELLEADDFIPSNPHEMAQHTKSHAWLVALAQKLALSEDCPVDGEAWNGSTEADGDVVQLAGVVTLSAHLGSRKRLDRAMRTLSAEVRRCMLAAGAADEADGVEFNFHPAQKWVSPSRRRYALALSAYSLKVKGLSKGQAQCVVRKALANLRGELADTDLVLHPALP